MIERLLKDKLLETKLLMSHERRKEIRKHLDYYSGTSTEQYINQYFNGDAFSDTFKQGDWIYGSWNNFTLSSGKVIAYFG